MTRGRSPIVALREWLVRLWGAIGSGRGDADMAEELRAHLELAAEDAGRRTPDVAARTALLRHGATAQTMDALRDQRGLPWLDDLTRDLRHGAAHAPPDAHLHHRRASDAGHRHRRQHGRLQRRQQRAAPAAALPATRAPGRGLAYGPGRIRDVEPCPAISASRPRCTSRTPSTTARSEHIGVWFAGSATVTGIAEPEQVRSLLTSPTACCRRSASSRCSDAGCRPPTRSRGRRAS